LLNYALATRQRQEVAAANNKMALVDKNLSFIEKEYAATKGNIVSEMEALKSQHAEEMSKLAKAYEEKMAKGKKDHAAALKEVQDDLAAKNGCIATLAKDNEVVLSELASLRREKEKWASDVEALEESVGAQYEVGFNFVLDQAKILFPDIDQARLGEAGALMKIVDGKLVPFAPLE
jgi:chromosome segregation ATPase